MIARLGLTIAALARDNPLGYAFVVVITMSMIGTLVGLLADLVLRCTGITFDEYTDSHAGERTGRG